MQPNQQEQNNQSMPPEQLQPNVPEFLHLDPILDTPKPSKRRLVIIVALITLLLGGAGAAIGVWSMALPERRLSEAMSNLMRTSYITRKYTVTTGSEKTVVADVASDFSNPARPKSELNYMFQSPTDIIGTAREKLSLKGDIVVLNSSDFYARLSQAPEGFLASGAALNRWYKIANPTLSTTTISAASFDYLKLRKLFNTPYTIFPTGNYSDAQREQLEQLIKSTNVYTINKTHEEVFDGKRSTVYTLTVDYPLLQQLHTQMDSFLKTNDMNFRYIDVLPVFSVWIDNDSNKVLKTVQKIDTKNDNRASTFEITYNYPASLSIEEPQGAAGLQ